MIPKGDKCDRMHKKRSIYKKTFLKQGKSLKIYCTILNVYCNDFQKKRNRFENLLKTPCHFKNLIKMVSWYREDRKINRFGVKGNMWRWVCV